jgi:hypothetical protein
MNLRYSIPNKLWYINNFLPYDMYKGIHNSIIKNRKTLPFKNTKGIWGNFLTENIDFPDRIEVENYKPFEDLITLIKHNPYHQISLTHKHISIIHYMKKDSGVQWHNDGGWKYGATLYLNNKWNKNWGGEFMFTSPEGHGFIPVVGNSLVIVKTPIEHKVNQICSPIMPRISVQIFMK